MTLTDIQLGEFRDRGILVLPGLFSPAEVALLRQAFEGEAWQWHYDFATHHHEDGVPRPLALNLHLFLDDVTLCGLLPGACMTRMQ